MIDWKAERAGTDRDIVIFHLSGELGVQDSNYLFAVLEDHIERGERRLVLNCFDLTFISSMGIAALVRAHSRMKKHGGDVKLARVRGIVADVLRIVMLDRLLQVFPTVRAAVASFQPDEKGTVTS